MRRPPALSRGNAPGIELLAGMRRIDVIRGIIIGLNLILDPVLTASKKVLVLDAVNQATDIGVELADRIPVAIFGHGVSDFGILDLQEVPELFVGKFAERDQDLAPAVGPLRSAFLVIRQRRWIRARRVEIQLRVGTHRVQDIARKGHVQHLFHGNTHDDPTGFIGEQVNRSNVFAGQEISLDGIIRVKINRNCCQFNLNGGLEVFFQLLHKLTVGHCGFQLLDQRFFGWC